MSKSQVFQVFSKVAHELIRYAVPPPAQVALVSGVLPGWRFNEGCDATIYVIEHLNSLLDESTDGVRVEFNKHSLQMIANR
ncbi:hypothetical protein DV096_19990 [Bradymonadaceae bacterium TMQ3]|nr:hypothetical protein DV096_19990 [Bradymonadaceae bacterium TMQ3]